MTSQYFMPTKLVSGTGCVTERGELMKPLGSSALIVTGARSAKASGALDDLTAALAANGQSWQVFDGAVPNPTVDSVYAGVDAVKKSGADFIAAIGGGSPMDTAKAIALAAAQNIPREALFSGAHPPLALPLVCIPTTSGTAVLWWRPETSESRPARKCPASCPCPRIRAKALQTPSPGR